VGTKKDAPPAVAKAMATTGEVRNPLDLATEAALIEARHVLGIFHEKGFLETGRKRRRVTDDERDPMHEQLGFKLAAAGMRFGIEIQPLWEEMTDKVAAAFTCEERAYLLRLLDDAAAKKKPQRGRPDGSRAFWIAQAVGRLIEGYGLNPTRNREHDPNSPASACAIVATVLAELGVDQNEVAVETIWARRRPEDFSLFDLPKSVRHKSG
jgi:hypothetical protein